MKKFFFVLTLIGLIASTSCRKNSGDAGSWTFGADKYTASSAVYSKTDNSLTASNGANNPSTLTVYFPSQPTASGSYRIVNYTSVPLDTNQVYVRFINDISSYYYFSTGNDNVYAKVAVSSGGKISVTIPAAFLESYSSPISDSAQVTATINQQ